MSPRRYKPQICRSQYQLLPARVDDYVAEDNPVRAIDCYVNSLDLLSLGFTNVTANASSSGQPAYDPAALLKLYLYGYINKVRSSRRLERECLRNLEVIWLIQSQTPSYKTIANFRKDNARALVQVNRQFLLLCRSLNLVGGEVVAIDGSFFSGNASKASIITKTRLTHQINKLDKQIRAYLQDMDLQDKQEADPIAPTSLTEKLDQLTNKKRALDQQLQALKSCQETQISQVDEDARLLSKKGQRVAGYNVQTAVDAKHKLIVTSEVTHAANDQHQLSPMAKAAKSALGVKRLTVLADAGYFESEEIRQCALNKITPYVPEPDKQQATRLEGRFSRQEFHFDKTHNQYRCPAGNRLLPVGNLGLKNGKKRQRYRSNSCDCMSCPLRSRCLKPDSKHRQIYRWEHEEYIEEHRIRMAESADSCMIQRASLVEHPFGTLKDRAGWSHFLVRGFERVRGEWSLMVMGYNLTRVLNTVGLRKFMAHCRQ